MIVRRSSESSVAYVFGTSISVAGAVRADMAELAAVPPDGEVRDDVELLAGVEEGALERQVVARGHDQLVRRAALAQQRRQGREQEAMNRRRRHVRARTARAARRTAAPSPCMTATYCATRGRAASVVAGILEPLRELRRQLGDVGAEHRHEPPGEHRRGHVVELVVGRRRRRARARARILPEDRRRGAAAGSGSGRSRARRRARAVVSWYTWSASACRPAR